MKTFNRRMALRGLGGLLISLPVLEGCTGTDGLWSGPSRDRGLARTGESLVETPAKRFIALNCPNGVEPDFWFPTGAGADFTLNVQNAPLEPVKQHLIMTRGIANKVAIDAQSAGFGNGHAEGVTSLLTGWGTRDLGGNNWRSLGGPSIDQMIAHMHEAQGYVGRVRGIHLGEEGPGSYSALSVADDGAVSDYTLDFSLLFDSPGSESALAIENARRRRQSVLDGSREDFARLAPRVSGEDRLRIESHLEALRSIETRLAEAPSCERPALAEWTNGDERRDLFYDVVVAAMACDASRVATVYFHHSGGGGPTLPFLGIYEDIHELSHQVVSEPAEHPSHAQFTAYHQWWSRKTLRLIERMKATPMPGGRTLFDDTVLFQGTELGWNHACWDMPFLIAAGEQTPFRTGRYVELFPRALHTHLLVTLLHAFGSDATHVGDPTYAPGDLDAAFFEA